MTEPVENFGPAPTGTYSMLEDLLEPDADTKIWGSSRHNTFIRVFAERECEETNGSCMDLYIRQRRGRSGPEDILHAHVTKADEIVRLTSDTLTQGTSAKNEPPKLEEMIKTLHEKRGILPSQSFRF